MDETEVGIAMFIRIGTGEVIPLPDADVDACSWAAANAGRLGIVPPVSFNHEHHQDVRSVRRSLASAGWCCAQAWGRDANLEPVSLDDLRDVLVLAMQHGMPHPESLGAMTVEADYIQLDRQQVDGLLRGDGLAPEVLWAKYGNNGDFNTILSQLRELPFADRMKVYGSAARGKPFPGDIDVWIDFRGTGFTMEDAEYVLAMAKGYPGMFDPVLATDAGCFSRGDWGTEWEIIPNHERVEEAVLAEGIPLSDFPELVSTRDACPTAPMP